MSPKATVGGPDMVEHMLKSRGPRLRFLMSFAIVMALSATLSSVAVAAPGYLDPTFDADGKVTTDGFGAGSDKGEAVAIQPDGKVVAFGSAWNGTNRDFALARYNTNGSLDTTFDGDGRVITDFSGKDESAYSVEVQPDGKIVVSGQTDKGSNRDFALARYNADGSLDTTFDGDGKVNTDLGSTGDAAYDIALQEDGKIVAAGYTYNGTNNDFALARYDTNGSLDASFGSVGKTSTDFFDNYGEVYGVTIQSNGKVVVAGGAYNGSVRDFALARYSSNGVLDTGFGTGGKVSTDFFGNYDEAKGVEIQANGKVVAVGHAYNGTNEDFALARYDGDSSTSTDTTDSHLHGQRYSDIPR